MVWSKDAEPHSKFFSKQFWLDEREHFLGQVSLAVDEIVSRGAQPWDAWFPLQKRSEKSHVSGEIYLSIQNLVPDVAAAEKMARDKIPVPHHQLFKYLLRGFFSSSSKFHFSPSFTPKSPPFYCCPCSTVEV